MSPALLNQNRAGAELLRELSFDARYHADTLSALASRALREGRHDEAVWLADRRCRIGPIARAPDFLLRAAALSAAGHADQAARDFAHALELDPESIVANQWLLKSPSAAVRRRAADTLLRRCRQPGDLMQALRVVAGEPVAGAACVEASFAGATGWFAWRGVDALKIEVRWRQGTAVVPLAPDPSHPFAGCFGAAADWSFDWPADAAWLAVHAAGIHLVPPEGMLWRPDLPGVQAAAAPTDPAQGVENSVAIIVPVYGDYPATKACLDSLLSDTASTTRRQIIVVDDATPDRDIKALLSSLAAEGRLRLIRQSLNHGFARSVNRGLRAAGREDVLVLNADTVVPPGFLDRLRAAAYSDDDIGTVTPLSNNGEYTSLPQPFRFNDMPGGETLLALDRAAAAANARRVVEMPNGIGFCMYVRRSCLDAIGPLRTSFGRGYYEDVDFCLRASEAGFRNVCATDVYVAHAGSRSFGARKRALVMRNLDVIHKAYPGYGAVSAAFVACDPLRPARAAIERVMLPREPRPLLVAGAAAGEDEIRRETEAIGGGAMPVLVTTTRLTAGRLIVDIASSDGGAPQNLRSEHPLVDAEAALANDLSELPIDHVVLGGAAAIPPAVQGALERLGKPIQISKVGHGDISELVLRAPADVQAPRHQPVRLGLVCPDGTVRTLAFLISLTRALAECDVDVVVLGSTFDDLRLMRSGRAFVTGALREEEYVGAFRRYRLSHVLLFRHVALKELGAGDRPAITTCAHLLGRVDASPSVVADALRQWVQPAKRAVA